MATADSTVVDGVTINLDVVDKTSPKIEEITSYLEKLRMAFTRSGNDADTAFTKVGAKIAGLKSSFVGVAWDDALKSLSGSWGKMLSSGQLSWGDYNIGVGKLEGLAVDKAALQKTFATDILTKTIAGRSIALSPETKDRLLATDVARMAEQAFNAIRTSGQPLAEATKGMVELLKELRGKGIISGNMAGAALSKATRQFGFTKEQRAEAQELLEANEEVKARVPATFEELASALIKVRIAFWAMVEPMKKLYSFHDHLRKINLQFEMMARGAMQSASTMAAMGGVLGQVGGSANDFASFSRNFQLEMEKRRIGTGNGGAFTQAWMRYGISYNPNDAQATLMGYARWFSDQRRTEAQIQSAGAMLGLSQPMIAALRKGEGWWREQQSREAKLTSNQEEAARKALELTAATSDLSMAWQNLKNGMFVAMMPAIKWLTENFTKLAAKMSDPGIAKGIAYLGGAAAAVVSLLGLWKLVKSLGSLLSVLGMLGGAKDATEAVSKGAINGGAVFRGAGLGALGKASGVAVGAGVVEAVAGGVQRQVQIFSLSVLEQVTKKWYYEWHLVNLMRGGGATRREVSNRANRLGVDIDLIQSAYNQLKIDTFTYEAIKSAGGAQGISIQGGVTINVSSANADPAAVAQEVRVALLSEVKSLVEYEGSVKA